MMSLVFFLLIGLLAGWLGSLVMGAAVAWWKCIILGIVGAFVGGFLVRFAGFKKKGLMAEVITAALGAAVCIAILRAL